MKVELPTEANPVVLLNADCAEMLREMPSDSVDAVVTDPPYGVGFKYDSHDDSPDGYGQWLWSILVEAERVARTGAPIMVWQAAKHVPHFGDWFPRRWRLLIAAKSFSQVLPGPTWPSYEPIVTWWKGDNGEAFGRCRRDFFLADTTPSGRGRRGEIVIGHPCPRPIHHAKWLVGNWAEPGGTVLDPFMGSGTTGVACVQTGRKFIGAEIDPGYFAVAEKRIGEAQGVGGLYCAPRSLFEATDKVG